MFKKTVKLEDFIRSLTGVIITSAPVDVLVLRDNFNFEELQRIRAELNTFRVIILFLLLLDNSFRDKLLIPEEEMSRIIGKATVLACRDKRIPTERASELLDIYFEYLKAILANPEREVLEKGVYFLACVHFASRLLPGVDLKDESQRLRHLDLFDAAKQVYGAVNKTFLMAYKNIRLEI